MTSEQESEILVRAEIATAALASDEQFVTVFCRFRGVADDAIVAIAKSQDTPVLRNIRAAWSVEPTTGEFSELDPGDVTCANEAYGV